MKDARNVPGRTLEQPEIVAGEPIGEDGRAWLERRIQALRSRAGNVGPFRAAGIQRTIAGMKRQLEDGIWNPHSG